MSPKTGQFDDYRRRNEDTGEWIYFCPDCKGESSDGPLEIGSLHKFKSHMQSTHGGYTITEEGSEALPGSDNPLQGTGPVKPPIGLGTAPVPTKPKRLSQRSRELNDKLNEALKLCVKHLLKGLSEEERSMLDDLRSEVTMGFVGIEIDFDEKLVSVSGKWAAIISVVALNVLPSLPSIKELIEKAKEGAPSSKIE